MKEIEDILAPLEQWAHQCHGASLKLVQAGIGTRVARGSCDGVGGQHSWVVVGDDCYAPDAQIIDPTRWSYTGEDPHVWMGSARDGLHHPHGSGLIWAWGRPNAATGEPVELTPRKSWSREAENFLNLLGPLDKDGWIALAHAPVGGWPAGEIIDAMCESGLEVYVPIDIVGMITSRNPKGLYLADDR